MKLRDWATPVTMGAFALMAVTGALLFFHLDTGLNKPAHEWLGWAMVAGVVAHGWANWGMVKRHFANRPALAIMAMFVVVLAASFVTPPGKAKGKPPHVAAAQALVDAPLPLVAQVAHKDIQAVVDALNAAGFPAVQTGTIHQAAGNEREAQMQALGVVFGR